MHIFLLIVLGCLKVNAFSSYSQSGGYQSCLQCHLHPTSYNSLNSQGYQKLAFELSQKPFWKPDISDEEMSRYSYVGGSEEVDYQYFKYLKPSLLVEVQHIERQWQSSKGFNQDLITRAEVNFFYQETQFVSQFINISYSEDIISNYHGLVIGTPDHHILYSKYHYITWMPSYDFIYYIGLQNKPFGLAADHSPLVKNQLALGKLDQSHGIIIQQTSQQRIFSAYIGSLYQKPELRPQGFSFVQEWTPIENSLIGVSFLTQEQINQKEQLLGGHLKFSQNKNLLIQLEHGVQRIEFKNPMLQRFSYQHYYTLSLDNIIENGVIIYAQSDYFDYRNNSNDADQIANQLGLSWIFFPKAQINFDFVNYQFINGLINNPQYWTFFTSLKLFL